MRFWAGMLWLFLCSNLYSQNCDLDIDVPDDLTICQPGFVALDGNIYGDYYGFEWIGSNGYYNNTTLNPVVQVNQNTTFTLKAYGDPKVNLIDNGDFESGNFGFTTQYAYNPVTLWGEGTYTITSNPNSVHTGFSPCPAQNLSQMMVLNGAPSLAEVWCQTVTIQPNTNYVFWAWATSVSSTNPARLQFSINGNLIGPMMQLNGSLCVWQQFYTVWNSGAQTSADICIVNQNTIHSGNDFAIDNVYFGPLCEEEASFDITIEEFEILPQTPDEINCYDFEQVIEANLSPPLSNPSYVWSTSNGSINSDPYDAFIYAGSGGTYQVTVTSENGCTETMSFYVEENINLPNIRISGNAMIDCNADEASLFAYEYEGLPCEFTWKTPGGQKINGPAITARSPGLYEITAIGENGCETTYSVEVTLSGNPFDYRTNIPEALTCVVDTSLLVVHIDLPIDSLIWSNGIKSTNPDTLESNTVLTTGWHYFTLYKGKNCQLTDSIFVDSLGLSTQYDLALPDTLTCHKDNTSIAIINKDQIKDIVWSHQGNELGRSDSITVFQPGKYDIILYDSLGCISYDSIYVAENKTKPAFSVEVDSIDCITKQGGFRLLTDVGNQIFWEGFGNTSDDIHPLFNQEGNYTLTLIGENGCVLTDTLYLPSSVEFPVADIGFDTINCLNTMAHIRIQTDVVNTILWTNPQNQTGNDLDFYTNQTGEFIINITNPKGCITTERIHIEIDTIRPIGFVFDPVVINCIDTQYIPAIIVHPDYKVVWKKDNVIISSTVHPVFTSQGTYALEIEGKNGCKSESFLNVEEDFVKPVVEPVYHDLNCHYPSTEVDISSQPDWLIFLDSQLTNENITITEAGMYSLRVVASNGCDTTVHLEIQSDFIRHDLQLDTVLLNCYQPVLNIQDVHYHPDVTYIWNRNGEESTADSILINGIENITLTAISKNGCDTTIQVVIKEDKIVPETKILGDKEIYCHADSTIIYIQPDLSYEWFWRHNQIIVEQEKVVEINQPSLIYLTITNPVNGCVFTDSIRITKQASPDVPDFEVIQPVCPEDAAWVNVRYPSGDQSPYDIWINNDKIQAEESQKLNLPGEYILLVKDQNGCTADTSFWVEKRRAFSITAPLDTTIIRGETVELNLVCNIPWDSISRIEWLPDTGLDCSDCFATLCSTVENTHYQIFVTDQYGCTRQDMVDVRVLALKGYDAPNVIIPGSSGNHLFTLYSRYNSIREIESLQIYDRWGSKLFENSHFQPDQNDQGWNGLFNGGVVNDGVYVWIAQIAYNDGTYEVATGDVTVLSR